MNSLQSQNADHQMIYDKYKTLLNKLILVIVIACIITRFLLVSNAKTLEQLFLSSKENELHIFLGFGALCYAFQMYSLTKDYQGKSDPIPIVLFTIINSIFLIFAISANFDPSLMRFHFSIFLILSLSQFVSKNWVVYLPIGAFNFFLSMLNNKMANLLFITASTLGFLSLKSLIKFFMTHPSQQLNKAFINQLFLAYATCGCAIIYSLSFFGQ